MGGYLSHPITKKLSQNFRNEKLVCGVSSMQGWRTKQEDAHNCLLDFDENTSLFGVYDGHDGAEVAIYTSEKLPEFIKNNEDYKKGNYQAALISAFLNFDDALRSETALARLKAIRNVDSHERSSSSEETSDAEGAPLEAAENEAENAPTSNKPNYEDKSSADKLLPDSSSSLSSSVPPSDSSSHWSKCVVESGCTAVVALIRDNNLYVANAGDSRCIISKNGAAVDMSEDHKPENELERARIVKAGGEVSGDGRVNGSLNLSRAIGDHEYKNRPELPNTEQVITALPDVRICKLDPEVEFIVLACDGIWNSMSSQEVVDFVRPKIQSNQKLSTICEELFDKCLSPNTLDDEKGCDNMTCIIVKLQRGENGICDTVEIDSKITTTSSTNAKADSAPPTEQSADNVVDSSHSEQDDQTNEAVLSAELSEASAAVKNGISSDVNLSSTSRKRCADSIEED